MFGGIWYHLEGENKTVDIDWRVLCWSYANKWGLYRKEQRKDQGTKTTFLKVLCLFPFCIYLRGFFFFPFIFISWSLITLQYCSGFCHTLTWIIHGFTCVPHPDPPSYVPPHPIPLGLPSAPALITSLMHPTWADNLFPSW